MIEKERERERERDRQTDRQTDGQTSCIDNERITISWSPAILT